MSIEYILGIIEYMSIEYILGLIKYNTQAMSTDSIFPGF